jgi:hypothetical protein
MARFIAQFSLPQSLRDVQVPRGEIHDVADLVHGVLDRAHPNGTVSREQVESVLIAAY